MSNYQAAEIFRTREEPDMEMSDNEDQTGDNDDLIEPPRTKKSKPDEASHKTQEDTMADFHKWHYEKLKEENESIKMQMEAQKNEMEMIKNNKDGGDERKQLKILQQTLQGVQTQLLESKRESQKFEDEVSYLRRFEDEVAQLKREKVNNLRANPIEIRDEEHADDDKEKNKSKTNGDDVDERPRKINEREGKLIGLISTFLHVHPFGASVDYIVSYLQRLDVIIRSPEVEDLLQSLPSVFRQDLKGVGAMLERRWKFLGFDGI